MREVIYGFLGFEGRIWDLIVLIPDHCLSVSGKCYCISHKSSESSDTVIYNNNESDLFSEEL